MGPVGSSSFRPQALHCHVAPAARDPGVPPPRGSIWALKGREHLEGRAVLPSNVVVTISKLEAPQLP